MDLTEFRRASHAVWEAMAGGWDARHAYFEETARPVTERMLERCSPAPGQTILDLAAGSGIAGFSAAPLVGPRGRVIVSDFAAAMVEAAKRRAAELGLENVECRVLDAERLELADGSVDGVLCRWGYMLMADPALALRETSRVLTRGGRLTCAVFGSVEHNPWVTLPTRVLQQRGRMPAPEAGAPGILALADRDRLSRLITAAGFTDPTIDHVPFVWAFDGVDDYWDFLTHAAGAIAMVLADLTADERALIRAEIAEALSPYAADGGVELPAACFVASAT